jgi:oligopeptide transport system permease protein
MRSLIRGCVMPDVAGARVGRWPVSAAGRSLDRLIGNRAVMSGGAVLLIIAASCAFGPLLAGYDPTATDLDAIWLPPLTQGHLLGTDDLGRDILVRALAGGRTSLLIGLLGTAIALFIGTLYGAVAGFLGGMVDAAMMRFVDVLYGLPFNFVVIALTLLVGRGFFPILIAIAGLGWLTVAVITRGETISLRQRLFVEAARVGGMRRLAIVRWHIIPNALGPVIVYASLLAPEVMLAESSLSFLGLGIQEPATSWGTLIGEGVRVVDATPWRLLAPAFLMSVTLAALNVVSSGLRDAFDPRTA